MRNFELFRMPDQVRYDIGIALCGSLPFDIHLYDLYNLI